MKLLMILTPRSMQIAAKIFQRFLAKSDTATSYKKDLEKFLQWSPYVTMKTNGGFITMVGMKIVQPSTEHIALPERDPASKERFAFISRTPWNVVHPGREVNHG